jgi:hypothetical protein
MSQPLPPLRSYIAQTLIVAYREDTSTLEQALRSEGLDPIVLRPEYTPLELTYSRTIRCLLNHTAAWRRASEVEGYTLVMEADFVPCRGFSDLPMPFAPESQGSAAWAFLYAGGPRIFKRLHDGSMPGHSACPVACLISPQVGKWLCDYTREELVRHSDLTRYSLWDTQFQWHMMGKGATCFMPWRHYGEHGGISNPEHLKAGVGVAKRNPLFRWLGLGSNHHAEVLYAPLHFLPAYAKGSRSRLWRTRLEAKVTAVLKLTCGKVATPDRECSMGERLRLYFSCVVRLCSPY